MDSKANTTEDDPKKRLRTAFVIFQAQLTEEYQISYTEALEQVSLEDLAIAEG